MFVHIGCNIFVQMEIIIAVHIESLIATPLRFFEPKCTKSRSVWHCLLLETAAQVSSVADKTCCSVPIPSAFYQMKSQTSFFLYLHLKNSLCYLIWVNFLDYSYHRSVRSTERLHWSISNAELSFVPHILLCVGLRCYYSSLFASKENTMPL